MVSLMYDYLVSIIPTPDVLVSSSGAHAIPNCIQLLLVHKIIS